MSTENNKPKIEALKAKAAKAESLTKRREIIAAFYNIIRSGAEVKVFNEDLQKDICINSISARETAAHAAISKASTLAVFELLEILKNAKKVEEVAVKENTTNQQRFKKMIILEYKLKDIGKVKLTVGVTKVEGKHMQYCLTAME